MESVINIIRRGYTVLMSMYLKCIFSSVNGFWRIVKFAVIIAVGGWLNTYSGLGKVYLPIAVNVMNVIFNRFDVNPIVRIAIVSYSKDMIIISLRYVLTHYHAIVGSEKAFLTFRLKRIRR